MSAIAIALGLSVAANAAVTLLLVREERRRRAADRMRRLYQASIEAFWFYGADGVDALFSGGVPQIDPVQSDWEALLDQKGREQAVIALRELGAVK